MFIAWSYIVVGVQLEYHILGWQIGITWMAIGG